MKKLMILGGSGYILPVIKKAHELGLYVITADYLPDNTAHKVSDEYCNVSVMNQDATLRVAQEKKIDGIISFACDAGAVTAAYVAEKMNLPFQGSYESTMILQDKGKFRSFLTKHGFNVPHAKRYTDTKAPSNDIDFFTWPVIVKPTDSAGSKGVTKIDSPDQLESAIDKAIKGSHNDAFIIEDFLTFQGYHSSADVFTVNGDVKFITYSDQLFDKEADNAYTPSLIIWPTTMSQEHQRYLSSETQRLMHLLHMKNGIYNIETCVGIDGKPYLMEVSPRGGGCKIAEIQELAMGVPLIENEIRGAMGLPLLEMNGHPCDGHWCEMVVHAAKGEQGILKRIVIDDGIKKKYLKIEALTAKPGDIVHPFTGGNMALGDLIFRFETREELETVMSESKKWLRIELR